jgi:hypothetical protein
MGGGIGDGQRDVANSKSAVHGHERIAPADYQ